MTFHRLAEYFSQIEATDSRLAMTELLAQVIKEASVGEAGKICYLSLGKLGPLFNNKEMNIGVKLAMDALALAGGSSRPLVEREYKKVGDLGKVALKMFAGSKGNGSLGVLNVFDSLQEIACQEGAGSRERKISLLAALLRKAGGLSAKYIIRIPVGALRMGFSDLTILDALSWMLRRNKDSRGEVEKAYNIYPDLERIMALVKKEGLVGLSKIQSTPGVPILSAKAQRLNDPQEIFNKMGSPLIVEPKLDGTRLQAHYDRDTSLLNVSPLVQADLFSSPAPYQGHIRLFSRNLEDMTAMFPDLCAGLWGQIKASQAILDGEALGVDPVTGNYVPFQQMITRKRKHQIGQAASQTPLRLVVFDLLYLDGESLLAKPLRERRSLLEKVIGKGETITLIEQENSSTAADLAKRFAKAKVGGLEGLMIKIPNGEYQAGARGFNWVKLKAELDTIDAVVMGYYAGRGKRAAFGIGAFLVGVYDNKLEKFVTLAKVGTGLDDSQWQQLKERCDKHRAKDCPKPYLVNDQLIPDIWVVPQEVVEIRSDEVTVSPLHTAGWDDKKKSGLALRFPRLISFRNDKSAWQATTVLELKNIFKGQV